MVVAVVTVPLSLMAAALVLDALGAGLNAIVVRRAGGRRAVVVDEAVAPADQVTAAAARAAFEPEPRGRVRSRWLGARTAIRAPLVYATADHRCWRSCRRVVIDGRPGAFFGPLVAAYAVAVAAARWSRSPSRRR